MVGGRDLLPEAADIHELHVGAAVTDGILELEEEGVLVPGELPAAPVDAAVDADGELVCDDDGAVSGGGGGRGGPLGVGVRVEVGDDAGDGHHARDPPPDLADRGRLP